jgi:hypothetical protein
MSWVARARGHPWECLVASEPNEKGYPGSPGLPNAAAGGCDPEAVIHRRSRTALPSVGARGRLGVEAGRGGGSELVLAASGGPVVRGSRSPPRRVREPSLAHTDPRRRRSSRPPPASPVPSVSMAARRPGRDGVPRDLPGPHEPTVGETSPFRVGRDPSRRRASRAAKGRGPSARVGVEISRRSLGRACLRHALSTGC